MDYSKLQKQILWSYQKNNCKYQGPIFPLAPQKYPSEALQDTLRWCRGDITEGKSNPDKLSCAAGEERDQDLLGLVRSDSR